MEKIDDVFHDLEMTQDPDLRDIIHSIYSCKGMENPMIEEAELDQDDVISTSSYVSEVEPQEREEATEEEAELIEVASKMSTIQLQVVERSKKAKLLVI